VRAERAARREIRVFICLLHKAARCGKPDRGLRWKKFPKPESPDTGEVLNENNGIAMA
jgi:hypothetical protein